MNPFSDIPLVNASKLPLLLCAIAFVFTFVATRIITRMIREGRGPFKNNSVGGIHVHHVVPGIIAMVVGGLVAIGAEKLFWESVAAVIFGVGLALVLDEFALVLHLEDVYWEEQGRLSVDLVFVIAAVLALVLVVGSPLGVDANEGASVSHIGLISFVILHLVGCLVTAFKGKYGTALVGMFIPVISFIGAIRLARPMSPWARWRYRDRPSAMDRARRREEHIGARYRSKVDALKRAVAGIP